MSRTLLISLILSIPTLATASPHCNFSDWSTFKNTKLLKNNESGSYMFSVSKVKVDADGAPNAYHPDDIGKHCTKGTNFKGLDCPANGGYPKSSWWSSVILPDPTNTTKAYIQKSGDFKGYFISQTSLKDSSKVNTDPSKYVDATTVPYLVFPKQFYLTKDTGTLGDLGYVINLSNGKTSPFIVAEVGPPDATLGEMSIALAKALGGENPNPRTGAGTPKGKLVFIVFPKSKSSPSWPLSLDDINNKVKTLMNDNHGTEAISACTEKL